MNDFTKEELQYFLMTMKPLHFLWRHDPLELENKLQSMIDNYCDPLNKSNPMYRCIRCKSKEIDMSYKIKYGLHDWLLCNQCTSQFREWVLDKNAENGCRWSKEHFKRKYGVKVNICEHEWYHSPINEIFCIKCKEYKS